MNSERMAVSRRLRVLALLWRCVSRWSRKPLISFSSRSSQSRADGALLVVACAKHSSSRRVSR